MRKKREMVQLPLQPLQPLFVRIGRDVFALLEAARDACNASRKPGESPVSLATMVERCVLAALAPGAEPGPRPPVGHPPRKP